MGEKLGIEALKNVIGAGFEVAHRGIEVTAPDSPGGKKITTGEVIGSVGPAFSLLKAVPQAKQAWEEVQDLSKEEESELLAWAAETFPIDNQKAEDVVLCSIQIVLDIAELVEILN